MAEFREVMGQARRLCKEVGDCDCCPLYDLVEELGDCPFFEDKLDAKTIEETVTKWATEHPEPKYPTWEEWQKANFPTAQDVMHPCAFMKREEVEKVRGVGCGHTSCNVCARSPIPADIAEKLGIKPIGGSDNG